MPFESNVFINCPFDDEFKPLLKPLIFCLIYFNLEPRISQTKSSSDIRINQIIKHIRNSRFSIHDLSRSKPMKEGELPRFNMPYELGLDIGCASFGGKKFRGKKILILETERYHYQKVISDIAGQDIKDHQDNPEVLIIKVRDWFSTIDVSRTYPGANSIWIAYNQFYDDISSILSERKFLSEEIENMPVSDFIKYAKDWITKFKL